MYMLSTPLESRVVQASEYRGTSSTKKHPTPPKNHHRVLIISLL